MLGQYISKYKVPGGETTMLDHGVIIIKHAILAMVFLEFDSTYYVHFVGISAGLPGSLICAK